MANVIIDQGELSGSIEKTLTGKTFSSFKGIPYGDPPIGYFRFRAPRPAKKWSGVRDATKHGNPCPQWDMGTNTTIEGNEDCLFLNVYTPKIDGPKLPVMVWFHGGGFQSGSADSLLYGPKYLIEEDVVLVTVNYRLEVLGFLCLNTKNVPGNAGMKDQVLSLKWVRDNISKFGGDPGNVTIFGESAGGASVAYHLISPMSKGLFHKAISQSGTCFNDWALSKDPVDLGFRVGKFLRLDTNDVNLLTKYLKAAPPMKLINMTANIINDKEKKLSFPLVFVPVVEKKFPGIEAFLPKSPEELIKEGNFSKVPILMGYNNAEGLIYLQATLKRSNYLENNFSVKLPSWIKEKASPNLANKLAKDMKTFYYSDRKINEDTVYNTLDVESDNIFNYGVQKFAKTIMLHNPQPLYFYRFSAESSELNFMKNLFGSGHLKGACHGDELFYLFSTWIEVERGSEDWKSIRQITKLWTNFAKYGNPTPSSDKTISTKWPCATSENFYFLDIGSELKLGEDPYKERYEFHEDMHEQVIKENKMIKSSL